MSELSLVTPYNVVDVRWDLTPEETTVSVSAEWLVRAFDIIVKNAMEAAAAVPYPSVTISTRRKNGRIEVLVADNGRGVPEQILEKLFREPIRKPGRSQGLGMGLLMAQAIIKTYGGDIHVDSSGPDGTTMAIWLPWKGKAAPSSSIEFAVYNRPGPSVE
jgi:signal transduction histidine kinase